MLRCAAYSIVVASMLVLATPASSAEHDPTANDVAVVSASTLTRKHTVTPTWPASAEGVAGWVKLRFTVMPNGAVTDVEVEDANPAGIFEDSAVQALRQWTFEPVEHEGKKIAQRAEIRMNYALEK